MIITATQLKQESYLMDNVKKEDIIITKRDRPFAVLMDIEKYNELINLKNTNSNQKKIEALNSLGSYALGGESISSVKEKMYENE